MKQRNGFDLELEKYAKELLSQNPDKIQSELNKPLFKKDPENINILDFDDFINIQQIKLFGIRYNRKYKCYGIVEVNQK